MPVNSPKFVSAHDLQALVNVLEARIVALEHGTKPDPAIASLTVEVASLTGQLADVTKKYEATTEFRDEQLQALAAANAKPSK